MAENKLEPSKRGSSGSAQVEVESVKGANTTRLAIVHGVTIVVAILAVGIVIAIWKDQKQERDYVSVLLPSLTAAITGFVGFLAGQKSRKD